MEYITKEGFRWVLSFCLNGKYEDMFCLSFQGLLNEDGTRFILFEKYFKEESKGIKYFNKLGLKEVLK